MKLKVFVDTNILLSGIFFEGNEAKILDLVEIELLTGEDVVDELRTVVKRKLKYLKERTFEIALSEGTTNGGQTPKLTFHEGKTHPLIPS